MTAPVMDPRCPDPTSRVLYAGLAVARRLLTEQPYVRSHTPQQYSCLPVTDNFLKKKIRKDWVFWVFFNHTQPTTWKACQSRTSSSHVVRDLYPILSDNTRRTKHYLPLQQQSFQQSPFPGQPGWKQHFHFSSFEEHWTPCLFFWKICFL